MAASTLAVATPSAGAAEAAPADATTPLSITAENFRFRDVPVFLRAGSSDVTLHNISEDDHVFVAVNLGPVCGPSVNTTADASALLARIDQEAGNNDPQAVFEAVCPGGSFEGAVFAPPGGTETDRIDFTPGKTLYFCPIPEEDGTPHSDLGMIGLINVIDPATRAGLPSGLDLLGSLRQPTGLRDLATALLPTGASLPGGFNFPNINGLLSGLNLPAGVGFPARLGLGTAG